MYMYSAIILYNTSLFSLGMKEFKDNDRKLFPYKFCTFSSLTVNDHNNSSYHIRHLAKPANFCESQLKGVEEGGE